MMMILHSAVSLFLLYSCFCRAVKMSHETRREVRLAFWALGVAATTCVFAPLRGWTPDYVSTALLIAITVVQTVTAQFWQAHQPPHFKNPSNVSCSG